MLVYGLSFSLIWTPALSMAAEFSLQSSISHLEMDLGAAYLRIEQIDSSIQLSPNINGTLNVGHFRAKRLVLTMKSNKNNANNASNLPNKINVPMPIVLQNALINELVIESGNEKQRFEKVAINLIVNDKTINIDMTSVASPIGAIKLKVDISNNKPFNLIGFIELQQASSNYPYQLRADLTGNLQSLHFKTNTSLQRENDQFALKTVANDASIAQMIAEGDVGLAGSFPVAIRARVQNFKPEYWHKNLAGLVNANIEINGNLAPNNVFNISANAIDSNISGLPLNFKSNFSIRNKQLKQLNITASLASNSLQALAENSIEEIKWQANLPDISSFGKDFAGNINANGLLGILGNKPTIEYQLLAEKLQLPNKIAIEKVEGDGRISFASDGTMQSNITMTRFSKDSSPAINAQLALQGKHGQHDLNIVVKNSNNDSQKLDLSASISGGFNNKGWQGKLERLNSLQKPIFKLTQAATMQYDQNNGFLLKDFNLSINQARLLIHNLAFGGASSTFILKTSGKLQQLALRDVSSPMFNLPFQLSDKLSTKWIESMSQNLVMSGNWNVNVADHIDANVQLMRDSGDITLTKPDSTKLNLGLQVMRVNIVIEKNNIQANTHIAGNHFGDISAEIASVISKTANTIGFAKNAPLKAKLVASLKTLAWLPLAESLQDAKADGKATLSMLVNGTVSAPNLQGSLNAENLSFNLASQGLDYKNGNIQSIFTNQYLDMNNIAFTGGEGTLTANGRAELVNGRPKIKLNWKAKQFTALSRTDRFIVLSGNANSTFENKLLTVNGDFKVFNGLFELPKQSLPVLGDDVVILGQEKLKTEAPTKINIGALNIDFGEKPRDASITTASTSNANLGIVFDSTKDFIIRGNGLDGYLTGVIHLSGKPQASINARGSLEIRGTYLAYGQQLNIETGSINFSGPIDNAGLNILATRYNEEVKAGVKITGTVLVPTVKLVSVPEVSDSDKLSYLILGQPSAKAGESDLAILSLAASALLSQGDSVPFQTRVARGVGLDSLTVTGTDASNYGIAVGKRLTSKLYLSYEKSLFGLLNVAKLTYDISRRVSLETQAGSDSAVDLLYTFSFN